LAYKVDKLREYVGVFGVFCSGQRHIEHLPGS